MVHYRSKSVPLVQNEMIFNNKLISQSYVPFVPNTNYNVIQTNNAQTGTVLINKPQNTITNPTKIQVLKNIENKMDNSNDLTKQKIKARAELKIIFKEIEGKELTEAENNDLKQKIKEVEKKYPNTVTDKTITKLCDNFKVKLPEENIQNMPNQVVTQSTENNEGNKEIEDSNLKSNEENMQSAKQNLQKINNDINQKTNQVNKSQVKRTGRSKEEKEKIIDEIFSDIFIQENSNDIDLTRIQGSDVPFISSYLLEYKNPKIQSKFDYVVVEGAGGITCPLILNGLLISDVIKALNLEIIIVAESGLGTINSTLLTVEYAKQHNIGIKGIVLNRFDKTNPMHIDNKKSIEYLTGIKVLAEIEENQTKWEIGQKKI